MRGVHALCSGEDDAASLSSSFPPPPHPACRASLKDHHIVSTLFIFSKSGPTHMYGLMVVVGCGVWEDLSSPTFSPPLQEHNVPTNDVVPINLLTSSPHPPHHNTITHPRTALHWQDSHTGASVLHSSLYCIMLCCHMDS